MITPIVIAAWLRLMNSLIAINTSLVKGCSLISFGTLIVANNKMMKTNIYIYMYINIYYIYVYIYNTWPRMIIGLSGMVHIPGGKNNDQCIIIV